VNSTVNGNRTSSKISGLGQRTVFFFAAVILWCLTAAPFGQWAALRDSANRAAGVNGQLDNYYHVICWAPFLLAVLVPLVLWLVPIRLNRSRILWVLIGSYMGSVVSLLLISLTRHFIPSRYLFDPLDLSLVATGMLAGFVAGTLRGKMDSAHTRADFFWDVLTVGIAVWIVMFRAMTGYACLEGHIASFLEFALYFVILTPIAFLTIPASVVVFGMTSKRVERSIAIASVVALAIIFTGTLFSSLLHVVLFFIGLPLVQPSNPVFSPVLWCSPLLAITWGSVIGTIAWQRAVFLSHSAPSGQS